MLVEKRICVNLESDELEVINRFIKLKKDFHNENLCDHLSCCDCPMKKLCDASISDAYEFQDMINESLDEI